MKTFGAVERAYVNVSGKGTEKGGVSGPSCLPLPQMELYFKQLEEGRRGAEGKKKSTEERKVGVCRGPFHQSSCVKL